MTDAAPPFIAKPLSNFTDWTPLRNCWRGEPIPDEQGIYRIRSAGADDLLYVGQTGSGGMSLRRRLAMLKAAFGPEMPYRDPHTFGPALWAHLHGGAPEPEVSTYPTPGLRTPERKGLEAVVIALHRQTFNRSPAFNFGRMPVGYGMSSANNASLVTRGKRFRGGPVSDDKLCHAAGIAPARPLKGSPVGEGWCGFPWMPWRPIGPAAAEAGAVLGVYRIRREGAAVLTYIGEGAIGQRLRLHIAKGRAPGHPQASFFTGVDALEASYVETPNLMRHQRQEYECDLIASHLLSEGVPPEAQFLG